MIDYSKYMINWTEMEDSHNRICVICIKSFPKSTKEGQFEAKTCSEECSKENKKRTSKKYNKNKDLRTCKKCVNCNKEFLARNNRFKYCSKPCRVFARIEATKRWRKANPEKTLECSRKNDEKRKTDPKRKQWEHDYYRRPEIREKNNQAQKYRYQNNINGKKDKHKAFRRRPEVIERNNRLAREKTANKIKPVLQKVCEWCECVYETTIPLSTRRWCSEKCRKTAWAHLPHNLLATRISNGIRKVLNPSIDKNDSSCFEYLSYTKDELREHFESYFTEESGYLWENMSEWHIDHIRPKSSFNFDSTDHPDFKKCWALNNLQPLWAEDNIRKGDYWDGVTNL